MKDLSLIEKDFFDLFFNRSSIERLTNFRNSNFDLKPKQKTKIFKDSNGEYAVMEFYVPGYSKENLKLQIISNKFLQIEGSMQDHQLKIIESINDSYDLKTVKAECKDGILKISFRISDPKTTIVPID